MGVRLLLVVGPTGVGKDTLLREARRHFASDGRVRFVRRVLTCPHQAGAVEEHESLVEADFAARRDSGGFAVTWRGNGVSYGIPAEVLLDGNVDHVAVCNVSRLVVAELARRTTTRVIEITAPVNVLARRLAASGRADAMDTARRLSRVVGLPQGVPSETLVNDGTVEQGTRRLVASIARALESWSAEPSGG